LIAEITSVSQAQSLLLASRQGGCGITDRRRPHRLETGHGGFGGGLLNEARNEWSDHSSTEKASAGEEADTLAVKFDLGMWIKRHQQLYCTICLNQGSVLSLFAS